MLAMDQMRAARRESLASARRRTPCLPRQRDSTGLKSSRGEIKAVADTVRDLRMAHGAPACLASTHRRPTSPVAGRACARKGRAASQSTSPRSDAIAEHWERVWTRIATGGRFEAREMRRVLRARNGSGCGGGRRGRERTATSSPSTEAMARARGTTDDGEDVRGATSSLLRQLQVPFYLSAHPPPAVHGVPLSYHVCRKPRTAVVFSPVCASAPAFHHAFATVPAYCIPASLNIQSPA